MDAGRKSEADGLIAARDEIDRLGQVIPGYAQGRARFQELTPAIQRAEKGPLGQVANPEGSAEVQFSRAMKALLPDSPEITDAATARTAVQRLQQRFDPRTRRPLEGGGVDPTVRQAVGQYIRTAVDDAAKQFKTKMTAQDAGAAFKAALTGKTRQAEILQAVITQTSGPEAWTGFQRMLDVFEAQGFRQAPGSQTTFNQMLKDMFEQPRMGVSGPEVAAAGLTGGKSVLMQGLRSLEKGAATQRGITTARHIDEWLLDPDSIGRLRQLAQMSPHSPNAARLVAEIMGAGAATAAGSKAQPVP